MQIPLLSVVITSGIIDSFNPCAISLLLIYISMMFTMKKSRKEIFSFGAVYIISIYITYFLIGITGMRLLRYLGAGFTANPIVKVGAILVIIFGLINIKEYFFPNAPFSVRIPLKVRGYVSKYAHQTTLASAAIVGFLIGVYEFPCSGIIYLTVINLLAAGTTRIIGIGYLLVYNFFFVLPLVLIFAAATNKVTTEKFINIQEQHGRKLHLLLAIFMILLGIFMLKLVL